MENDILELKASVATLQSANSDLSAALANLENRLAVLENAPPSVPADYDDVKLDISSVRSDAESIGMRVSQIENLNIGESLSHNEQRFDALENRVAIAEEGAGITEYEAFLLKWAGRTLPGFFSSDVPGVWTSPITYTYDLKYGS